ncbi:MAG: c-type cytochrome [Pseudomonadota bacterium]|nr:c-type cytochrome [Pseudomonadota bacterium]
MVFVRALLALLLIMPLVPSAGAQSTPPRSGANIVRAMCVNCHGPGLGGAPRIGNAREWRSRARAGIDNLVRSASEGKGAMPARGGMPDLTDAELREAIAYMFEQSTSKPE